MKSTYVTTMPRPFINLSNHPSATWSAVQRHQAESYGPVVDIPFPIVDPSASVEVVAELGSQVVTRVLELNPSVVLCQGEYSLSFDMIHRLLLSGIRVVAASTSRNVLSEVLEDGSTRKTTLFSFVQFREYRIP